MKLWSRLGLKIHAYKSIESYKVYLWFVYPPIMKYSKKSLLSRLWPLHIGQGFSTVRIFPCPCIYNRIRFLRGFFLWQSICKCSICDFNLQVRLWHHCGLAGIVVTSLWPSRHCRHWKQQIQGQITQFLLWGNRSPSFVNRVNMNNARHDSHFTVECD